MAFVALLWGLWWFSFGGSVSVSAAHCYASWIPVAVAPLRLGSSHHRLARQLPVVQNTAPVLPLRYRTGKPAWRLLQQTKDGTSGDDTGINNRNDVEAEDWEKIPDYDGIGTLAGNQRLFVLPTESNMLRHVTNYLRNQQDLADALTEESRDDEDDDDLANQRPRKMESEWIMPQQTMVSFQQLVNDSYEENGEGTNIATNNTTPAPAFVTSTAARLLESSRARQNLLDKKAKSLTDANSVFERYKNGTLSKSDECNIGSYGTGADAAGLDVTSRSSDIEVNDDSADTPQLPPFPSRQDCIGFWRMIQSPTGFVVEDSRPNDMNAASSDNLILRVDGTIAGGPILDQELRHKAAGGKWDIITTDSNVNNSHTSVLRVALIIPPSKKRMLVMEGELLQRPSNQSHLGELSSSPFRDAILQCTGSVWLQDINLAMTELSNTGSHRDEIGTFRMQQLPATDRQVYTITVPRNIRPGD